MIYNSWIIQSSVSLTNTLLDQGNSPAVISAIMKQQTTETDQPKVELQTKKQDNTKDDGENEDAKELAENIKDAISRGDIDVEVLGDKVVVNFTPTKADEKELPNLLQETLNAVESAKAGSGKSETEVLIGGMDKQLAMLATASAAKGKQDAQSQQGINSGESEETAKQEEKKEHERRRRFKIGKLLLWVGSKSEVFSHLTPQELL